MGGKSFPHISFKLFQGTCLIYRNVVINQSMSCLVICAFYFNEISHFYVDSHKNLRQIYPSCACQLLHLML